MKDKLEFLIVEDKPEFVDFLRSEGVKIAKERNVNLNVVETFKDYQEYEKSHPIDVIATDLLIPYSKDKKENKRMVKDYWNKIIEEAKGYLREITKGDSECKSLKGIVDDSECKSLQKRLSEYRLFQERHNYEPRIKSFKFIPGKEHSLDKGLVFMSSGAEEGHLIWLSKIINEDRVTLKRAQSLYERIERQYLIYREPINLMRIDEGKPLKELKTCAPLGLEIFEDNFYNKKKPVFIQTDGHCHGTNASMPLIFFQNKGKEKYGVYPYEALRGELRFIEIYKRNTTAREDIMTILDYGITNYRLRKILEDNNELFSKIASLGRNDGIRANLVKGDRINYEYIKKYLEKEQIDYPKYRDGAKQIIDLMKKPENKNYFS